MGKSMYNYRSQSKENARQQKQMDKAAKRLITKQNKTREDIPNGDAAAAEPDKTEETAKGAA